MSHLRVGHSAGQLETRGIEPVPENECNGNPLQLFWVWFAANISILGLPLGATLVAFHQLAIWQVIIVALIGAAGSFAVVDLYCWPPWACAQPDSVEGYFRRAGQHRSHAGLADFTGRLGNRQHHDGSLCITGTEQHRVWHPDRS